MNAIVPIKEQLTIMITLERDPAKGAGTVGGVTKDDALGTDAEAVIRRAVETLLGPSTWALGHYSSDHRLREIRPERY